MNERLLSKMQRYVATPERGIERSHGRDLSVPPLLPYGTPCYRESLAPPPFPERHDGAIAPAMLWGRIE
ncbi:MAG: hypothetical protein NVSMB22_13910 [Chloroflexota bacterium]